MEDAVVPSMSMREKYQTRIEEKLTGWSARLDALRTQAGDHAMGGFEAALEEWKVALAKLHELRAASGGQWGALKAELDSVCRAIEAVLGRVLHTEPAIGPIRDTSASTRITERAMPAVVPEGGPPTTV